MYTEADNKRDSDKIIAVLEARDKFSAEHVIHRSLCFDQAHRNALMEQVAFLAEQANQQVRRSAETSLQQERAYGDDRYKSLVRWDQKLAKLLRYIVELNRKEAGTMITGWEGML